MLKTTITNFRKNLYSMVDQTTKYDEPITVSTKTGNAVLISEEEYNSLMETLYLTAIPGMEESLLAAKDEPLEKGANAQKSNGNWTMWQVIFSRQAVKDLQKIKLLGCHLKFTNLLTY